MTTEGHDHIEDAGPSPVTGARDVADEDLPEDLRPAEDNPLAQPLDPDAEDEGGLDLQDRT
ncbi:MAG: hypothetical protein ACTHNS_03615 [Marmoricola sp.]